MRTLIEQRIIARCREVEANEAAFHCLSACEKIAVGLVLDRVELVKGYGTMLQAFRRLGLDWQEAAMRVQSVGWRDEQPEVES